jgi:hypothetical protein
MRKKVIHNGWDGEANKNFDILTKEKMKKQS